MTVGAGGCWLGCLCRMGFETHHDRGRKNKNEMLRLPSIQTFNGHMRQMIWSEEIQNVIKR